MIYRIVSFAKDFLKVNLMSLKSILAASLIAISPLVLATDADCPFETIIERGESFDLTPTHTLTDVVDQVEALKDTDVVVSGRVETVCKKMGCWYELVDSKNRRVRVMFGHKFFVPKDSAGMQAFVKGRPLVKTIAAKAANHMVNDDGANLTLNADGTASEVWLKATGTILVGESS